MLSCLLQDLFSFFFNKREHFVERCCFQQYPRKPPSSRSQAMTYCGNRSFSISSVLWSFVDTMKNIRHWRIFAVKSFFAKHPFFCSGINNELLNSCSKHWFFRYYHLPFIKKNWVNGFDHLSHKAYLLFDWKSTKIYIFQVTCG